METDACISSSAFAHSVAVMMGETPKHIEQHKKPLGRVIKPKQPDKPDPLPSPELLADIKHLTERGWTLYQVSELMMVPLLDIHMAYRRVMGRLK